MGGGVGSRSLGRNARGGRRGAQSPSTAPSERTGGRRRPWHSKPFVSEEVIFLLSLFWVDFLGSRYNEVVQPHVVLVFVLLPQYPSWMPRRLGPAGRLIGCGIPETAFGDVTAGQ